MLPVLAGLFPDAPATGLAKFDLGSIPASVTPPRTWRHAAWFAVAASILVLVGLSYAAVTLVTAPRKPDVVEALPGLPSGPELPPEPILSQRPVTPTRPPSSAPPSTRPPSSSAKPSAHKPVAREDVAAPAPSAPPSVSPTAEPSAPDGPVPPTRTTLETPVLVGPIADAEKIGDRTETYFRQVTQNPDEAYAMTTGQARRDGQDEIARRYGDVTRVEVQQITIDSNRSVTRSTMRVHRKDGTISTEERELTFTYGTDPKITNDIGK